MAERFDIENYMKDLTPEQQEKARECKTIEEFNEFVADNNLAGAVLSELVPSKEGHPFGTDRVRVSLWLTT